MTIPFRFPPAPRPKRLVPMATDETAVAVPGALERPSAAAPDIEQAIDPTAPFSVEPRGRGFFEGLKFVLGQELAPENRARPGAALMVEGEGDVGIDPPAMAEFERRNPDVARRILGRLDQTFEENDPASRRLGRTRQANYLRSVYADIWNAAGADRLPPALQLVHFDTAVNLGPGQAQRLLEESGGNPERYLDLREEHYRKLMTGPGSDQPQGRFQEVPAEQTGWLKQRMPALRAATASLRAVGRIAQRREEE